MSGAEENAVRANTKRTRVLFVIWSLERGGAERFLVSLLESLDQRRIDPVVCCLNHKGDWAHQVEQAGIPVYALNKLPGPDPLCLIRLMKLIRKVRPDVINTHLWTADCFGRVAGILMGGVPLVTTLQNVDQWKTRWHRTIDRLLGHWTRRFIAVSGQVKQYYVREVGLPYQRIEVIPNALDVERYARVTETAALREKLGIDAEAFVLSCIARLNAQKAHHDLIKAFATLRSRGHTAVLLLVGKGEEQERLERLVAKAGLVDDVRFLGQREDVPELIAISDCVTLSSVYEGLPVCLLEAMAGRTAVVTTDVGGVSELVEDGKTGLVVPPRRPDLLAVAYERLVTDPGLRARLAQGGHDTVAERFSIVTVSRRTEDLFRSVV